MTKSNRLFGLIGLLAVIIGFISKAFYRDYININEINDFGIAEFLPSYFYVLGFSLLLLIRPTRFPKLIILIVTFASILFELKQYVSSGIFDINDMLASIAGGISAIFLLRINGKKLDINEHSS
jgi:glucan phosphoethanolaminetransferase (alkaline phosphatase superfamily)